jgi:hypothetical protein
MLSCAKVENSFSDNVDGKKSNLGEQWAEFIARQQQKTRRHSRLHDDPEQQEEHDEDLFPQLLRQKEKIEQSLTEAQDSKRLHQFELACFAIARSFLQEHQKGHSDAKYQLYSCLQLASRLKLLQDPRWSEMLQVIDIQGQQQPVPVYSVNQLEKDLAVDEAERDKLVKYLIEVLLDKNSVYRNATDESLELLKGKLEQIKSDKNCYETLATLLIKRGNEGLSESAKEFYMAAVLGAGTADALLSKKGSKRDIFPELEGAYSSVVMLYLKAHDAGHPFAIKDAQEIMNGPLSIIIDWKSKHTDRDALRLWAEMWHEINVRIMQQQMK